MNGGDVIKVFRILCFGPHNHLVDGHVTNKNENGIFSVSNALTSFNMTLFTTDSPGGSGEACRSRTCSCLVVNDGIITDYTVSITHCQITPEFPLLTPEVICVGVVGS